MSGLIRSLDALTPTMRERAAYFLQQCETAGHKLFVFETLRTDLVQAAYCVQGRKPLAEVNAARTVAGLGGISEEENHRVITDPPPRGLLTVYKGIGHGNGTAMDVVPISTDGKLLWRSAPEIWLTIGEIAELSGLVWGGRWKPIDKRTKLGCDPNHVQLPRADG
jgi:hypothetical protein